MSGAALTMTQVAKSFGNVAALVDLTLQVEFGQIVGLLGLNGAGKTTAIRIICGLSRPDAGQVKVLGGAPPGPRSSQIGVILEQPAFYPWLSGLENLRIVLDASGGGDARRIHECLELVKLNGAGGRTLKGYSQGMRQRLSLAAACLKSPRLLIMDEPTNGLDPEGIRDFRGILSDLKSSGVSVFLSSHILGEVEKTCDHVVIVRAGRVVRSGRLQDILSEEGRVTIEVRIDELERAKAAFAASGVAFAVDGNSLVVSEHDRPRAMQSLIGGGLEILSVGHSRNIEDVFFSTIGEPT